MAMSGTQTTYNGNYYLKIVWDVTSQSITNNTSNVRVRMYLGAKSGWSLSDSTNSWTLSFDGSSYSGSNASFSINGSEDLFATYTKTVDHSSNGSKTISINGSIAGLYFGGINPTSFSGTLNTIPRASSISSSADFTAGANKTVSISRYSSSFNHKLKIYITKGTEEDFIQEIPYSTSETSKSTAWTANEIEDMFNQGHGYWTGTKMVLETYSGSTLIGTSTKTGDLDYPSNNSVGSISNFNLGSNASVSISKASSLYSHEIELRIGSTVIGSSGVTSDTSASINVDENAILDLTPSSKTATIDLYIRTVITTNTTIEVRGWTKEDSATCTLINVNPTFSSSQFTFLDSNTVITAKTGNNQVIVSGLSTLQVNINTGATASRGATISSYQVSAGGKTGSRANIGAVSLGAIVAETNINIVVTAVDSRGFTTAVSKSAVTIPYKAPTIVGNATRNNGFDEATTLRTSGVVNRLEVGGVKKNTLTSLKYRTKENPSGAFGSYVNIAFTAPTTDKYTASNVALTIPTGSSWTIEVQAIDTMGSTTTVSYVVASGVPIFFIDSDKNSIGFNKLPTLLNTFEMFGKMMFDRSKYATGTTNDAPINFNNSDAIGLNGIFFNDVADNNGEGILFPKTGTSTAYETAYDLAGWNNFRIKDDIAMVDGVPVFRKDTLLLWSGAVSLGSTTTVTYSGGRSVSADCPTGIFLIFGDDGSDVNLVPVFIPKWMISNLSGKEIFATIPNGGNMTANAPNLAVKSIYLYNTGFKGDAGNTGTAIQDDVFLRYIIGF